MPAVKVLTLVTGDVSWWVTHIAKLSMLRYHRKYGTINWVQKIGTKYYEILASSTVQDQSSS